MKIRALMFRVGWVIWLIRLWSWDCCSVWRLLRSMPLWGPRPGPAAWWGWKKMETYKNGQKSSPKCQSPWSTKRKRNAKKKSDVSLYQEIQNGKFEGNTSKLPRNPKISKEIPQNSCELQAISSKELLWKTPWGSFESGGETNRRLTGTGGLAEDGWERGHWEEKHVLYLQLFDSDLR